MKESIHPTIADPPHPTRFFVIYLVLGGTAAIALQGGWWAVIAPLGVTFGLVPIVVVLMGVDSRNPREQAPGLPARVLFRIATWLAVPVLLAFLFFMAWRVIQPAATAIEIVGGVLSAGIAGGVVGITVAHELIHRRSRVDRFLGGVLLASMSYLHWALEHIAGHHRLVATRADPATARLGESLPRFLVRSIVHDGLAVTTPTVPSL